MRSAEDIYEAMERIFAECTGDEDVTAEALQRLRGKVEDETKLSSDEVGALFRKALRLWNDKLRQRELITHDFTKFIGSQFGATGARLSPSSRLRQ